MSNVTLPNAGVSLTIGGDKVSREFYRWMHDVTERVGGVTGPGTAEAMAAAEEAAKAAKAAAELAGAAFLHMPQDGEDGARGPQGEQGPPGPAGPAGTGGGADSGMVAAFLLADTYAEDTIPIPGPKGDAGASGGTVAMGAAVVDFGATPVAEATFTVTDAGISGSSAISVFVMGDSTADNDSQSHIQAGRAFRLTATPGSGAFDLDVMALMGLCTGTFNIHYTYTP